MSPPVSAGDLRPAPDHANPGQVGDVIHALWDLAGVTCVADAIRLERHLRALTGVRAAVVNPVSERTSSPSIAASFLSTMLPRRSLAWDFTPGEPVGDEPVHHERGQAIAR